MVEAGSTPEASRAVRLAMAATVAVAAVYLLLYLAIAGLRIGHPFELEWLEGSVAHAVQRILDGEKIYVKPSIEFAPHAYTPLYFYVSAGICKLTGLSLLPLRMISFAAILGTFVLIGLFVRRETGSLRLGWIAAGLFAATFRIGGAWFDVARVDSLFLLLVLAALTVARFHPRRGVPAAAALFFLATLTKQSALVVAVPVWAYLLLVDWRRGLRWGLVLAAALIGTSLLLDHLHDGWYLYYTVKMLGQHPTVPVPYWSHLLETLPVVCALSLITLAVGAWRREREVLFHALAALGMVGVSWSSIRHAGGYANVLMPGYAYLAVLFGLGLGVSTRWLARTPGRGAASATMALWALCLLQFWLLRYSPREQVPTRADREAGEAFVERLRGIEGEVYLPGHGYLADLAGKRSYAHENNLGDIFRGTDKALKRELIEDVNAAMRERRFAAIVLDNYFTFHPRHPMFRFTELRENYRQLPDSLFTDDDAFYPVTGGRVRPETLFVPR
ncbi:MAG: glycosyltransferase family 39 protein [Myxococcota bacterium]